MRKIEAKVYKEIRKNTPKGYRLNELIIFSYPVRKIRMEVEVEKKPEMSLINLYAILLRAVDSGMNTAQKLSHLLGNNSDNSEMKELLERAYITEINEIWHVSKTGYEFLENNDLLKLYCKEDFEFLMDGITGEILHVIPYFAVKDELPKFLNTEFHVPNRGTTLLDDKWEDLVEVYPIITGNTNKLVSAATDRLKFDSYTQNDSGFWLNYCLVEYIPQEDCDTIPMLEVRTIDSLYKLQKQISETFNKDYRKYISLLSDSSRIKIDDPALVELHETPLYKLYSDPFESLTIWETKEKFLNALKNVDCRILIESPWIKKATMSYIPIFEEYILKLNKKLIILYGISEKDEHDTVTVIELEALQDKYPDNFVLIHLPSYFEEMNIKLTGTHRKLLIKDNDYYILGSFNFLSFGKSSKQKVANEESLLVKNNVKEKWKKIVNQYSLNEVSLQ